MNEVSVELASARQNTSAGPRIAGCSLSIIETLVARTAVALPVNRDLGFRCLRLHASRPRRSRIVEADCSES